MANLEISEFINHFTDLLDDTDPGMVKPETVFRDLEEWDSLTALSLIGMADDEYQVKLTGDDIRSSTTLQQVFDIIKSKA
jgi:acyl carrier protein